MASEEENFLQKLFILTFRNTPTTRRVGVKMKRAGYNIMLAAAIFVAIGGIIDISMTFTGSSIPSVHQQFLPSGSASTNHAFVILDKALLRALGACLFAVGIGAIYLVSSGVRNNAKGSLLSLLCIITISEGMNAFGIWQIGSWFYIFPLLFVCLTWVGAFFWIRKW